MRINNNFNVLPFYDSLQKQNSKKWYSFGQHYPLICPNNTILPFQFITDSEVTFSSNIEAVNVHSGKVTNLGVKPSVSKGTQADATYYIVKMVETTISAMPEGLHYLRINTNKGYLYSEEFTFNANHEECIKIEYWNENTLNFNSGEINFDDDFRFILYIPSTIGKPEYEFEEELTKRLGYKFIESQTSNKIYKFNFLAPEYICDAMRLIRLCDYIKLTTKFDTFNALSFAYEPKWQDNGDLAAVDVEFDTDCIIQKLESFNRRLKESFYNALLADIDEPVLFSNDIVAQYYTEFTTTSYINGKLIRQLESINEADFGSLENLVLPIDNQADTEQKAKKITLASLKNVLIKLADYVTLTTAQNINGEKNFIGGLKVNGSPIIYDSVNKCWKLQGNLVLTGGITMYADDGTLNLPSIYDGLPIDGTTIYWDTDAAGNRVLKAVGGGGTADSVAWNNITGKPSWIGSSKPTYSYSEIQNTPDLSQYATKTEVSKKWTQDDTKIANWDSAFGWGNHANAGYVKKTYVDETFVNLTGEQTISGKKNFTTGGLFVNGSQIKYDSTKKYWKLDGDLLVTGGITMYGNEGTYTPSTIMDAIAVDETTISKSGGVLKVIGGTGGGVADSVAWANITGKPNFALVATSGKYDDLIGKPTLLSSFTDDIVSGKYLSLSGGTINGDLFVANSYGGIVFTNTTYNSKAFLIYSGNADWYVTNKDWGQGYNLWHSGNFNPSLYLPLSGGTLDGNLTLRAATASYDSWVQFSNKEDSVVHKLGIRRPEISFGLQYYNGSEYYKIWHEGNDGSSSGLDADLLDGQEETTFAKWKGNIAYSGEFRHIGYAYASEGWYMSGAAMSIGASSNYYMQLQGYYSATEGVRLVARYMYNGTFSSWRNIAFEDSNVASATRIMLNYSYNQNVDYPIVFASRDNIGTAKNGVLYLDFGGRPTYNPSTNTLSVANLSGNSSSATKLQTARTIWGQSFDGTGNVDGDLIQTKGGSYGGPNGGNNFYIYTRATSDVNGRAGALRWVFNDYSVFKRLDVIGENGGTTTTIASFLDNGDVGIGTTSPSYKLSVNGVIGTNSGLFSPYIRFNSIGAGTYNIGSITTNSTYGLELEAAKATDSATGTALPIFIGWRGGALGIKITSGGNLLANGGITMYSDQRKKTILHHVELSLKQIAKAPLIEHYYNSDEKKTTHVGSIAQYWYGLNDWFCKMDSEGYLTMEIQNAALASAISIARELVRYETKTDKAIKKLKKRISELEDEVERLKSA